MRAEGERRGLVLPRVLPAGQSSFPPKGRMIPARLFRALGIIER